MSLDAFLGAVKPTAATVEPPNKAESVPWLTHPVVLTDDEGGVETWSWIEATDGVTPENAAEKSKAMIGVEYFDRMRPVETTGPFWLVPWHPNYPEGDGYAKPVPLDLKTADPYFDERVQWRQLDEQGGEALPFWRIEWEAE